MSTTASIVATPRRWLGQVLRSRWADRLATPHGIEGYVQLFAPRFSLSEVRAEVVDIRCPTANAVSIVLRPNALWRGFAAGQYVRVSVPVDGVWQTRCYSPANAEQSADGLLELTARVHPHGRVSNALSTQLAVGDTVRLSQAEGRFALPKLRPQRLLLISGGSGITPVMSMLRTLCEEGYTGAISFMHYASNATLQLYADELRTLAARHPNLQLLLGYSDGSGELGARFSADALSQWVPDYATAETYTCGPQGLMDAVQALWQTEGIAEKLHHEAFTAALTPAVTTSEVNGTVQFVRSGRSAQGNGESLLAQAETAGLQPEYGCRMGICHACLCTKTAGRVRDMRDGTISDDGEGTIQLCISAPHGPVTLDL